MSQADNLLNSLSEEEIAAYTANSETEPHIVIGADRKITVPAELKRVAIQYDHNVETVTFDCPRYWDEHDLSEMVLYINYILADGEIGTYVAENITVENDIMHFTWTISDNITQQVGSIKFLICAKKLGEATYTNTYIAATASNDDNVYITDYRTVDGEIVYKTSETLTTYEATDTVVDAETLNNGTVTLVSGAMINGQHLPEGYSEGDLEIYKVYYNGITTYFVTPGYSDASMSTETTNSYALVVNTITPTEPIYLVARAEIADAGWFVVDVRGEDIVTNTWHSDLCVDMYVSEGIECTTYDVESDYPDIITQLLARMDELEANGGGGGSYVEVDQSYSPRSENAQSGKAVAEAIVNKPTMFTGTEVSIDDPTLELTLICEKDDELYNAKVGDLYMNTDEENLYNVVNVEHAYDGFHDEMYVRFKRLTVCAEIGSIETALDSIIAIQETLIGGGE